MKTSLAPGFHVAAGRSVDSAAYDMSTGQWSRLFVPSVLDAAGVDQGCRVLDVATGTGEAALAIAPVIGASGILLARILLPPCLRAPVLDCTKPHFCQSRRTGKRCRSPTAASTPSSVSLVCSSSRTPVWG